MDDFCFFGLQFTSCDEQEKTTLRLVDGKILRVTVGKHSGGYMATAKLYRPEEFVKSDSGLVSFELPQSYFDNTVHDALRAALASVAYLRPRYDHNCVVPFYGNFVYADFKSADELESFYRALRTAGVRYDEVHTLAIFNYRAAMPGQSESAPMLRLAMNRGLHKDFTHPYGFGHEDNHQMVVRVGGRHEEFVEVYFFSDFAMTVGTDWSNIRISKSGW